MQTRNYIPVFDQLGLMVGVVPNWFVRTMHYAELVLILSLALLFIPPMWEEYQGKEIDVWWYSYSAVALFSSFLYCLWGVIVKDDLYMIDKKPTWPGRGWSSDVWTGSIPAQG